MRLGTVGGVTEWARIAMLTSGWSCSAVPRPRDGPRALTRSSGTYASSTVRRPSRKKGVASARRSVATFNSLGVTGTDASAAAEVGPDGRDGGRGGVRAAASKMGDTGKAVRKCIELPVIDRDAGRAQRHGVFVTLVA